MDNNYIGNKEHTFFIPTLVVILKRVFTYLFSFLVLLSCGTYEERIEDDIIDLVSDQDIRISDFKEMVEVKAWRKNSNLSGQPQFWRIIDEIALYSDILRIESADVNWGEPLSADTMDGSTKFQLQIALSDIDTGKFETYQWGDVKWFRIAGKDSNQIDWIKFEKYNGNWIKLWSVKSNTMQIPFLTSKAKIQKYFDNYWMFDPNEEKSMDYVQCKSDSVESNKITQMVIRSIKGLLPTTHKG